MTDLDRADLKMALVAVSWYRRAFVLAKRPVPPAAERLAQHLEEALAANGQETLAAQPHWVSTKQMAQRLGCSDRTARRIAKQVGHRVGRAWIIPADALPSEEDE
jgi:AraC-like DNA-binding protein